MLQGKALPACHCMTERLHIGHVVEGSGWHVFDIHRHRLGLSLPVSFMSHLKSRSSIAFSFSLDHLIFHPSFTRISHRVSGIPMITFTPETSIFAHADVVARPRIGAIQIVVVGQP